VSARQLPPDTAWTFDDRAPGLHLNRSELQRSVVLYGSAERSRRFGEADLHWNRIRDLLYPTLPPEVQVVPIESLAPEAEG
jgi:hypothetical protein